MQLLLFCLLHFRPQILSVGLKSISVKSWFQGETTAFLLPGRALDISHLLKLPSNPVQNPPF